jgi:endoglucanase
VRGVGPSAVVPAGGIYWAWSMDPRLAYRPVDSQLAASFRAYSFNEYCSDESCYDRSPAPIVSKGPLVAGEIGPTLAKDLGRSRGAG